MAHEKVFAICENKCFVETITKEQYESESRAPATQSVDGLMTASDKLKLDDINVENPISYTEEYNEALSLWEINSSTIGKIYKMKTKSTEEKTVNIKNVSGKFTKVFITKYYREQEGSYTVTSLFEGVLENNNSIQVKFAYPVNGNGQYKDCYISIYSEPLKHLK